MDDTLSLPLQAQAFEGRIRFANSELNAIPNKRLLAISYPDSARADLQARLGAMPEPSKSMKLGDNADLLWTGIGELYVLGNEDGPDANALSEGIGDTGYVTDLSDGWIALELEGGDAQARLDLVVTPDLSEGSFAVGDVTSSILSHIRMLIWRRTETAFVLLSTASTAAPCFRGCATNCPFLIDLRNLINEKEPDCRGLDPGPRRDRKSQSGRPGRRDRALRSGRGGRCSTGHQQRGRRL